MALFKERRSCALPVCSGDPDPGNVRTPDNAAASGNLRCCFILAAICFLLYFKTVFFGYTYLDDTDLIVNNTAMVNKSSSIIAAFRHDVLPHPHQPATQYRPLLIVSFILNAMIAGTAPWPFHLINIGLHCCASCLVFLLLMRLRNDRKPAFFFAAVFAVHPALTQAVAWIPGRADSLMTIFALSSFISFVGATKRTNLLSYAWHLLWLVCALLSKETGLSVIILCALYLHAIRRERFRFLREGIIWAAWTVIVLLWLMIRNAAFQTPAPLSPSDMAFSMLTKLPSVVQYIGKSFFPCNLSVFPIMRDTTFFYGAIASALLALLVLRTGRRHLPLELFGISWFVLFLVPPFMQPDPLPLANFFEHRLYLPITGLFIFLLETDAVHALFSRPRHASAVCGVLILTFAGLAFAYSENFRDRMGFWTNAVRTSPHSSRARLSLGYLYFLGGNLDKAAAEYNKALALNPAEIKVHNNLGLVYMLQGRYADAEVEYLREILHNPLYENTYCNLGLLYYRNLGKKDDAVFLWKKAIEINPGYGEAYRRLMEHYNRTGDSAAARLYHKEYQNKCPSATAADAGRP